MQHEVTVRNNDGGSSYRIMMNLAEEEARILEEFGVRLANDSCWSLSMTVLPVPPA